MQVKLVEGPLLNEKGELFQAGYATQLVRRYDRTAICAGAARIKEWDYYYVGNDHYGVALTIADNSYMGLDSISLLDFDLKWQHTQSPMRLLTWGKTGLPSTSLEGDVAAKQKGYELKFTIQGQTRRLMARMDRFFEGKPIHVDITLTQEPTDTMVIATPFPGAPKAFYYNQKINCLRASGKVSFDGRDYVLEPGSAMGVLDWGRGVWTYKNTWYWGSASGWHKDHALGFNIGYGFGDTSKATENMVFYDGTAHKLSQVIFHIPQKADGQADYLRPWRFTSDDGRFEMDFEPVLDRASYTSALVISSDQHQVFGRFTGRIVLDDGSELAVKDLMGFAEKVTNRW